LITSNLRARDFLLNRHRRNAAKPVHSERLARCNGLIFRGEAVLTDGESPTIRTDFSVLHSADLFSTFLVQSPTMGQMDRNNCAASKTRAYQKATGSAPGAPPLMKEEQQWA
jgi:hypothetical protein